MMMFVLIVPLWNWNYLMCCAIYTQNTSFNRTFMELKLINHRPKSGDMRVLIVPLWNWNQHYQQQQQTLAKVFIVPLWNWNSLVISSCILLSNVLIVPLWNWNTTCCWVLEQCNSFNRTFMELKFTSLSQVASNTRCFNRTFMELKCLHWLRLWLVLIVLIVPLWNWNERT